MVAQHRNAAALTFTVVAASQAVRSLSSAARAAGSGASQAGTTSCVLTVAPSGFPGQLLSPVALTGAPAPGTGTGKPWRVPGWRVPELGVPGCCPRASEATAGAGPGRLTAHSSFTAISTKMIERVFSGAVTRYVCPAGACVSAGRSVWCACPVPSRTLIQACRVLSKGGPRAAVTPGHREDTHLSHEIINEGTHLCHVRS